MKKIIIFVLTIMIALTMLGCENNQEIESDIVSFYYSTSGMNGFTKYNVSVNDDKTIFSYESRCVNCNEHKEINEEISDSYLKELSKLVNDYNIYEWDGFDKNEEGLMDGGSFKLEIAFKDGKSIKARGYGKSPDNYREAINAIIELFSPLI
jgi:uncharacterized lipoprotein NlpE involved in copper resistance